MTREIDRTWDLTCLYAGFDDPAYAADRTELAELADAYAARVDELAEDPEAFDADELVRLLEMEERMWVLGADLTKFTSLSQAVDAADAAAQASMGKLNAIFARMALPTSLVCRWTAELDLTEDDFARLPVLDAYRFLIGQMIERGHHMLSPEEENLFARVQPFAGQAWVDQRNVLVSFASAELDGQKRSLTELRNFATSTDADLRRRAFDAEIECSRSIEQGMSFCLNGIKAQESMEAQMRGYASVLDLTMAQSHMKAATLDALWTSVRAHLPMFHAYMRKKAQMLGHEGGLPWWDVLAGVGACSRVFSIDDARDYLVKHLGGFAPDLGELVERAFANRWIDFYTRMGKSGGAFCRNLTNQRESRVLTNFDGSLKAVTTIAHELGHAYHGQQIEDHRPLNRTYTMPVAETASNFNEILVMNAAIAEAEGAERLALLEQRLQACTQTVCDIYSRFLFEKSVIEQNREGFLFPDKLCELMTAAQKEAYGDGLDEGALHPYMWVNKVHYYSPDLAYYNFPYAFGLLLSAGLYERYKAEGPAFAQRYRDMLASTTVCTVEDAAAVAGVDVTTVEFWDSCFAAVALQIEEFLQA